MQEKLGKQKLRAMASRQKLIDAARRLFTEYSIDAVGVREIAAEAGATTGTFYHYFKSKDDILHFVYENNDVRFGEILESYLAEPPYIDRIVEFFGIMADTVAVDGADFTLHRMFMHKARSTSDQRLFKGMTALIEKGQEAGEIDSRLDASEVNRQLWSLFRGVQYDWCMDGDYAAGSLKTRLCQAVRLMLIGARSRD